MSLRAWHLQLDAFVQVPFAAPCRLSGGRHQFLPQVLVHGGINPLPCVLLRLGVTRALNDPQTQYYH